MAAIFGGQKFGISKTQSSAAGVPNHDVCRLSYYLRSCTVSCGVDIIVDELVDYKNAHNLPSDRQDAIFKLAVDDFNLEKMHGATLFYDKDNDLLPRGTGNDFYEVSKVSSLLAVTGEALIGGQKKEVKKIVVVSEDWLNNNYAKPLERNKERIKRILSKDDPMSRLAELFAAAVIKAALEDDDKENESKHCSHCRGKEGPCACDKGCEPKSNTECTAKTRHCIHCPGTPGQACTCPEGCVAPARAKCKVVHFTITCDSCMTQGIQGARYKCAQCWNYDLCQECYGDGKHDLSHKFERYARNGSTPVPLAPRKPPPITPRSPTPKAPSHGQNEKDVFVQAVPVNNAAAKSEYQVGQSVRLRRLNTAHMNGKQAEIVSILSDQLFVRIDGRTVKVSKSNVEPIVSISPYSKGEVVQLSGLKSFAHLNGQLAAIMNENWLPNGRIQVQLLNDESRVMNVKPENLSALDELS